MPNLYQMNVLTVASIDEDGVFLDAGEYEDIRLQDPAEDIQVGDKVEVFLYWSTAENVVATVAPAYAKVGECAYLEVVADEEHVAFLDWGLPKDLFLPHSEQAYYVDEGNRCVVYVYLDQQGRPVASTKLHKFLDEQQGNLDVGQQVDLLIADKTDLGFKAVINNKHLGLIYHGELSQPLEIGATMKGWVKKIRDDGKINLNVNALDSESRDELGSEILKRLKEAGGRIELSDKSSPEKIFSVFKVSKKNFKRAIGSLYKQRLIKISPKFIELV
jgi:predicted RNA-binding protein (virulence factor B family)